MNVNYDYQVKLLGILPQGFAFGPVPQRWDVSDGDLKVIPTPSEQIKFTGIVEKEGHPNLKGTAIVEKLSQIKPKPSRHHHYSHCENDVSSHNSDSDDEGSESSWVTDESENSGSGTEDESDSANSEDTKSLVPSVSISSSSKSIRSNFRLTTLNDWNRGSLRMRWLKNNFASETDELPQITCSRRFLCQFMTKRERFYTVKAKKITFFSRGDTNQGRYVVIELSGGYSFHNLKDPYEEKKEKRDFFQPQESSGTEYSQDKSTAFFSAVLSRIGSGGVGSHKIKILFDSTIDGVWKKHEDPVNYECKDIAEIRHVDASTIYPPPWRGFLHQYKQCMLAEHWAQSKLIGAKQYVVNVYGDKNDDFTNVDKKVKEMWLYDVDSMPTMIKQAARTEGFRAWNKKDLLSYLYNNLQYIRNYMAGSGISEDETIYFIHYENENHLLPLNTEDMDDELICLREAKKTVIVKNITFDSPDLMIAEENARNLVETLMGQESGTDRWPKPQLLMFPEEQMFHLKFKYLQHASTFVRIAKKFLRMNSSPALRTVRISRQITERLQNLLTRTAGYDDDREDYQNHVRHQPREQSSHINQGYRHYSVPATNIVHSGLGPFIFPNATTDQNWRLALNMPYVGK